MATNLRTEHLNEQIRNSSGEILKAFNKAATGATLVPRFFFCRPINLGFELEKIALMADHLAIPAYSHRLL